MHLRFGAESRNWRGKNEAFLLAGTIWVLLLLFLKLYSKNNSREKATKLLKKKKVPRKSWKFFLAIQTQLSEEQVNKV